MLRGTEQERALRRAAQAAIEDTADEMHPGDDERARRLATVISEVFREPAPAERPPGRQLMTLEALQAGMAGQMAVLDDARWASGGPSPAGILAVPTGVLAAKLTGHPVQQISLRGSGGGPLTPLASQLNHDPTHLQGQRTEGMLARLVSEVQDVCPDGVHYEG